MNLQIDRVESAMGTILLVTDGECLCALDFADCETRMAELLQRRFGPYRLNESTDPLGFSSRMRAYLSGDLTAIESIPVRTDGSPFHRRVWAALRAIPAGTTTTYGALAATLGQPTASRAVGLANSRNPVGIVVPCHRVIGANATLTGYAGGLGRKRWLLEHEGITLAEPRR
jgi:methylated-DNA-[protein]-cysteine S-methyltransferase